MRFAAFLSGPARDHDGAQRLAPYYSEQSDMEESVNEIYDVQRNHISKNVSNPVGARIKELTYLLSYTIRTLYEVHDC